MLKLIFWIEHLKELLIIIGVVIGIIIFAIIVFIIYAVCGKDND